MVLVGVGTFFAQATATGFVGRAARSDRGSASGIYLAVISWRISRERLLGQVFDHFGWRATITGISAWLAIAALLSLRLRA